MSKFSDIIDQRTREALDAFPTGAHGIIVDVPLSPEGMVDVLINSRTVAGQRKIRVPWPTDGTSGKIRNPRIGMGVSISFIDGDIGKAVITGVFDLHPEITKEALRNVNRPTATDKRIVVP